jgi:hypothetical protein
MRRIIAGFLSALLLVTVSNTAGAQSRKKERDELGSFATRYPGATPRQLRNLRAYERGEYYERDSNALPAGSRPWWEQKERESGGVARP